MSDDLILEMGDGGVPAGMYSAEYLGAERFEENAEKYGPAVKLLWKVIGGDHDGENTSRICSLKLSPKSAYGKMAVALKGGPISRGERFDPNEHVGLKGSVMVEETDSGATRVATFIPTR